VYARVYMDGSFFGDIDALRTIPADDLEAIEYVGARDATTLYGTGNLGGVIDLHTRGREIR